MRNASVFASVVGLLMTLAAQSATLQTGDDLRLGLWPSGRVTNLTIGRTVLPLKGEGVVVERFGSYSDGGLHLTLRSYAKQLSISITPSER